LLDKYPNTLFINKALMHMIEIPIVRKFIRNRLKPRECYTFWEKMSNGFSEPCRDLTKDDITSRSRRNIVNGLSEITTKKRHRLLLKITGWPRTGFLSDVFPDAKFIHIMRDGRAVVNSLINVGFWSGWKGPSNWRWGELSSEHHSEWIASDRSFFVLAALEWKIQMEAIKKALSVLDQSNVFEFKYEDFVRNPKDMIKKASQFSNLPVDKNLWTNIDSFNLKNMNFKWKENIPKPEQKKIVACLHDELTNYGYEI